MYDAPLKSTETPPGQKFSIGNRVKLVEDKWNFKAGEIGTVEYSYAQKYQPFGFERNVKSYALNFERCGSVAWFEENELELAE